MHLLSLFTKGILALLLSLSCAPAIAQFTAGKPYQTGELPEISRFEKLTEREAIIDTVLFRHYWERITSMEDGTAFVEGGSAEDQAKMAAYYKADFSRYKDNRSRYYLTAYTNGQPNREPFLGTDTVTTECNCTLAGDTLQVHMGIWVFWGFCRTTDAAGKLFPKHLLGRHPQATHVPRTPRRYRTDR